MAGFFHVRKFRTEGLLGQHSLVSSMYVCVCMCMCVYVCVHVYVCVCVCVCVLYMYMHVRIGPLAIAYVYLLQWWPVILYLYACVWLCAGQESVFG